MVGEEVGRGGRGALTQAGTLDYERIWVQKKHDVF